MTKPYSVFLCFILILFFQQIQSQCSFTSKGKEFWVGFIQNADSTVSSPVPKDSIKIIVSSSVNTTGTLSIPLQNYIVNFTVTADASAEIDIPVTIAVSQTSEVVEGKGIFIQTQDVASVFAQHTELYSDDAALVVPLPVLGSDYRIISYSGRSEFVIVATQDSTEVAITSVSVTNGGKPANVPFSIILNRGEMYQVQSSGDLSGTTVVDTSGNKPFAVFSGTMCSEVKWTACDHLFEQNLPTGKWGTEFHIIPFWFSSDTSKNKYTYRVLAHQNGTVINIDNGPPINLSAGEVYEQNQKTTALCISAGQPVNVTQYMQGGGEFGPISYFGDPAMLVLNSDEKKMTSVVFKPFATSTGASFDSINNLQYRDTFYINVLMETAYINQLKLDGSFVNPNEFTPFTYCCGYSYLQKPVLKGNHTLQADSGFIAYLYGIPIPDGFESYAMALGFETISPVKTCGNISVICGEAGETVTMQNGWNYTWNPAAGITPLNTNQAYVHPSVNTTYTLTGTNSCGNSSAIIHVILGASPTLSVSSDLSVCQGESTVLTASGATGYLWNPSPALSSATGSSVNTLLSLTTTTFTVVGTATNQCYDVDYVTVVVASAPTVDAGEDVSICMGSAALLSASLWNSSFLWYPPDGLSCTTCQSTSASPSVTGWYTVTVVNGSCIKSDSAQVVVSGQPAGMNVPNVFTPNGDDSNDFFKLLDSNLVELTCTIYNRWGEQVSTMKGINSFWDGKYSGVGGSNVPEGVYVYIIKAASLCGEAYEQKGTITLIR